MIGPEDEEEVERDDPFEKLNELVEPATRPDGWVEPEAQEDPDD